MRAALLTALQHADGLFPSGGFAFSQGLEARAAQTCAFGPLDLGAFVDAQLRHRWQGFDRVALVRAHRLAGDLAALAALDAEVEASSASERLRDGSRRNGTALLTTHERLGTPGAAAYRDAVRAGEAHGHLPVVQGLAWSALGIDLATAARISGYTTVTGILNAAVRLALCGAIEAQARVAASLALIEALADRPVADDQPLAAFLPQVDIAVARGAAVELRLFAN